MVLIAVAIPLSWTFNGEYEALVAISSLIVIDFVTGTYAAIKTNLGVLGLLLVVLLNFLDT